MNRAHFQELRDYLTRLKRTPEDFDYCKLFTDIKCNRVCGCLVAACVTLERDKYQDLLYRSRSASAFRVMFPDRTEDALKIIKDYLGVTRNQAWYLFGFSGTHGYFNIAHGHGLAGIEEALRRLAMVEGGIIQ